MPGEPVDDDEISPGLVLHLDPDEFEAAGATFTCEPALRVQGGHFFACLSVADDGRSTWAPLFTADGPGRVAVDTAGSTGHPKVTGGTFRYHPDQTWDASPEQVRSAARAGGDLSRKTSRNRLDPSHLPDT